MPRCFIISIPDWYSTQIAFKLSRERSFFGVGPDFPSISLVIEILQTNQIRKVHYFPLIELVVRSFRCVFHSGWPQLKVLVEPFQIVRLDANGISSNHKNTLDILIYYSTQLSIIQIRMKSYFFGLFLQFNSLETFLLPRKVFLVDATS